jgi:hypothetical protein
VLTLTALAARAAATVNSARQQSSGIGARAFTSILTSSGAERESTVNVSSPPSTMFQARRRWRLAMSAWRSPAIADLDSLKGDMPGSLMRSTGTIND